MAEAYKTQEVDEALPRSVIRHHLKTNIRAQLLILLADRPGMSLEELAETTAAPAALVRVIIYTDEFQHALKAAFGKQYPRKVHDARVKLLEATSKAAALLARTVDDNEAPLSQRLEAAEMVLEHTAPLYEPRVPAAKGGAGEAVANVNVSIAADTLTLARERLNTRAETLVVGESAGQSNQLQIEHGPGRGSRA